MESPIIQITANDETEVNYQLEQSGSIIEIEGSLIAKESGRCTFYTFEPAYFLNEASEEYYNENWENIESEILEAFEKQVNLPV